MNIITKVIHEYKRHFAIYILSCLVGTTGVSLLMNSMYGLIFGMMDSVNELTAHSFAVIIEKGFDDKQLCKFNKFANRYFTAVIVRGAN